MRWNSLTSGVKIKANVHSSPNTCELAATIMGVSNFLVGMVKWTMECYC